MKIGILGAMPQEISLLQKDLRTVNRQTRGRREYLEGTLHGRNVVLVFSRCAKVAAASTVTTLIEVFGVELVIFTGVAGAADPNLEIGDVVIGNTLVQHDMDARPLFRRFEVPLLEQFAFKPPPKLIALARQSVESYLHNQIRLDVAPTILRSFGIISPKIYDGLIVSGDQFVANSETLLHLKMALTQAGLAAPLCVEMEGAAVGQVCYEHEIPMLVLRTISDKSDHSAAVDFVSFVEKVASHFTCGIVKELIRRI